MFDEKMVETLVSIGRDLSKIETTIDRLNSKLDRVIDMLEKSADRTDARDRRVDAPGILRTQPPSIIAPDYDVPLVRRVIKSSLPYVSGCDVVMFYGPDIKDTKFVAECVFLHAGSTIISTEFAVPNDYDMAMKKLGNESDPFGRRARESGCQSHIVVGWDEMVPKTHARVWVRVSRTGIDRISWEAIGDTKDTSGKILIGPA